MLNWTMFLQETISLLEAMPDGTPFIEKTSWGFLDATAPLPFEELLAPFVAVARQHFLARVGSAADLLSEAAQRTLQRHLLEVLTSLAVPTLDVEYTRHSTDRVGAIPSTLRMPDDGPDFLQQMCRGGFAALLRTYSVLARLLVTTCELWVEANVEFVRRLAADWLELGEMSGNGDGLGQVTEIEPALSDPHADRRFVMALTFANGNRLVYKPRPIGMERAFASLLLWCNAQGATPPLKTLKMLDRDTYGWVEFVTQELCPDQQALRRYYRRSGMLLCLIYVLGGMYCFSDQLIAHGEHPVLVDTGHLLHPYFSPDPASRQGEDWEQAAYSVLHTGLLASWHMPTDGALVSNKYAGDISGLCLSQGDEDVAQEGGQQRHLKHSLTLKYGSLKIRAPLNMATVAGVSRHLHRSELYEELSTGFRDMYRLMLRQRTALLADESPLQAMKIAYTQITYRDRAVYERLLPRILAPQALRDATMRNQLLEPLGNENVPIEWFRVGKRDHAHWWPVSTAERQALLQGDIFVVSARAQSDSLMIGPDQEIEACLFEPAFDLMLRRLESLNEADLEFQLALIQHALPQESMLVFSLGREVERCEPTDELSESSSFMKQALAIAEDLVRLAVKTRRDSVLWLKQTFSYRLQQSQLLPIGYGFSDGSSGIAFFLAALAQQTGIASYRKIAAAAIRPLRHKVHEEGKRLVCEMGLGAGLGLGSVVYALTHLSQFLSEPELLTDAEVAARLITPDLIAQDSLLDVFMGAAGTLLGLLALYEVSPTQEVLDRAVWCGEHLLRARTPSKADCLVWPTMAGRHTSGFAHGTAGIVYALLRLYVVTRDASLLEAAQEGLCYENHALVYEKGNWMEEIGTRRADFGNSWCHGAPGIGLARIGCLPALDTPSIRQDIELALQTTQQLRIAGADHLCCGVSGRAEILLSAARRLGRPQLAAVAGSTVKEMFARAQQRGGISFGSILPGWVPRSDLFHGMAGIGYTLLRLARPGVLPSPLLWE